MIVQAEVPRLLSYTGRLTDPAGRPILEAKTLQFKIYDAETYGNTLWTSGNYPTSPDSGGTFSILLGSQSDPVPQAVFAGTEAYLEINVEGTILTPRLRLVSVPYAYRASFADNVVHALFPGSNISVTTSQSNGTGTATIEVVTDGGTITTNNNGELEVTDGGIKSEKLDTISSPSNGDVLSWNGSAMTWAPTAVGNVPIDNVTIGRNIVTSSLEVKDFGISNDKIANGTIDLTAKVTGLLPNANLATITTAGKVSGNAITTGTIGGDTVINTTGNITAASYFGDGSNLTGLTANNAASLEGEPGSYYLSRTNHTGTQDWNTIDTATNKVDLTSQVTGLLPNANLATITTAGKVSGNAITTGTIGGDTVIDTTGNITATSFYGDGS
ncbi:MAG: hypothetical protein KKC80_02325, partial [Candidatus Margulisbacteria bacterium]|nr:hypothetical protein [Candidatus Margulisiibacteriota bacterium]